MVFIWLLKFLTENNIRADIKALFFIAIPFLGDGGWQYEGMFLKDDFAAALPQAPLFFYHSIGDAIVSLSPFGFSVFQHLHSFNKE